MNNSIMLDVLMVTYNHEDYIVEAIKSVISQKVLFSYRLLIFDDCSTDATKVKCLDYCDKHPDIIKYYRSESNLGLVLNYERAFNTVNAKYTAILEGDDYWCDENKLQSQVDILERSDKISIVHTGFNVLFEDGNLKRAHLGKHKGVLSGNRLLDYLKGRTTISPHTVVYRTDLFHKYVDYKFCVDNKLWTIDMFLWPFLLKNGEIAYIDNVTSVYRVHEKGLSNSFNIEKVRKRLFDRQITLLYFKEKFEIDSLNVSKLISKDLDTLIGKLVIVGNKVDALILVNENIDKISIFKKILSYISGNPLLYFQLQSRIIRKLSTVKQNILTRLEQG